MTEAFAKAKLFSSSVFSQNLLEIGSHIVIQNIMKLSYKINMTMMKEVDATVRNQKEVIWLRVTM